MIIIIIRIVITSAFVILPLVFIQAEHVHKWRNVRNQALACEECAPMCGSEPEKWQEDDKKQDIYNIFVLYAVLCTSSFEPFITVTTTNRIVIWKVLQNSTTKLFAYESSCLLEYLLNLLHHASVIHLGFVKMFLKLYGAMLVKFYP